MTMTCRKTMQPCPTPGMCAPHGGCPATETVSSTWLTQLRREFVEVGQQRAQLLAENKALRALKLPDFLHLSDEMRAAGDHASARAREDGCYSVPVLYGVFFEAAIQSWLNDQDEALETAIATADDRPAGCCCPPPGHTGIWAASMCPVHHGLRRTAL